jgi:hypothetical protein
MRLPLRTDPWPVPREGRAAKECPICGMPWRPWKGSRLPCHGRCLLNESGIAQVMHLWKTSPGSLIQIAEKLGVPASVVSATLHANGVARR